jgi:replicative superfamily II helicase
METDEAVHVPVDLDNFKIVYIAPMKALVQEVRLRPRLL